LQYETHFSLHSSFFLSLHILLTALHLSVFSVLFSNQDSISYWALIVFVIMKTTLIKNLLIQNFSIICVCLCMLWFMRSYFSENESLTFFEETNRISLSLSLSHTHRGRGTSSIFLYVCLSISYRHTHTHTNTHTVGGRERERERERDRDWERINGVWMVKRPANTFLFYLLGKGINIVGKWSNLLTNKRAGKTLKLRLFEISFNYLNYKWNWTLNIQ
jgi:hypothetical protein